MKTKQWIMAFAVLTLVVLARASWANDEAKTTRVKVDETAPDFVCRTISGEDFSLSKEKGKVVVLNFFATWCGPCLAEMPHLEKQIYQKYKSRKDFKLLVLGREHDAGELVEFLKKNKLSLPMAPDRKRDIYGKYAEQFIPRTFVIGKDGKIKLTSVGYTESGFQEILQTIEKELGR